MINSVSTTNLLQNYGVKPATEQPKAAKSKPTEQSEIAQDIVKKETADATKAYAAGIVKPKATSEKKSLDELKADLKEQGKVEGKDFKIENKEDKQGNFGHELIILENDKPVKTYYFNKIGSETQELQLVTDYSYPMNLSTLANNDKAPEIKSIETTYGADGEFHFRTTKYERENSPYKDEIVDYNTKPFELEEKLKANGVQFARDLEHSNDNKDLETHIISKITAFDTKTGEISRYEFEYGKDMNTINSVTKNLINKNGNIESSITFRDNETSYTEFEDSFKA